MAKQKIVYNADGYNNQVENSSSNPIAYVDLQNTIIQNLNIAKLTSSFGSGILSSSEAGKLGSIPVSGISSGQYLQSNGTVWQFSDPQSNPGTLFVAGSDLTGTLSNPTALNITNVVSGTLSSNNGGTGVISFTSGGILVKDDTGVMKFIPADSVASVLRPTGNTWYSGGSTGTASYSVQTTYFTCSNPLTSSTYSWTKPSNHRNIKIILMGGGGGGGGGILNPTSSPSTGYGFGGGAAGFSVYDFIESGNLTANVTIGAGGAGGVAYNPTLRAGGSNGGNTIFSSSLPSRFYFTTFGGEGASTSAVGAKGFGNIVSGSENGGRGGGGGGVGLTGSSGGAGRLINFNVAVGGSGGAQNTAGGVGSSTVTAFGAEEYFALIGGGGGGGGSIATIGSRGGNGGNGVYGSGGGGSANTGNSTPPITRGGNGGDGYAIIISW